MQALRTAVVGLGWWGRQIANFEAWAAAVAGEAPYRFTRDQILDNVRILDAVARSAQAGGELIAL
jgi:predicted dehydrogenase